jgi:hypothetical protein
VLPSQLAANLAQPKGTIEFTYRFARVASGPPETEAVLLDFPAGETMSRLAVDPQGFARFTRTTLVGGARSVEVDVSDLFGSAAWFVALVWSEDILAIHVGDVERAIGLRSAENDAQATEPAASPVHRHAVDTRRWVGPDMPAGRAMRVVREADSIGVMPSGLGSVVVAAKQYGDHLALAIGWEDQGTVNITGAWRLYDIDAGQTLSPFYVLDQFLARFGREIRIGSQTGRFLSDVVGEGIEIVDPIARSSGEQVVLGVVRARHETPRDLRFVGAFAVSMTAYFASMKDHGAPVGIPPQQPGPPFS